MHTHKQQILPTSPQESPPLHQGHQQYQRPHAPRSIKVSKGSEKSNTHKKYPKRTLESNCPDSNSSATSYGLCDIWVSNEASRSRSFLIHKMGIISVPSSWNCCEDTVTACCVTSMAPGTKLYAWDIIVNLHYFYQKRKRERKEEGEEEGRGKSRRRKTKGERKRETQGEGEGGEGRGGENSSFFCDDGRNSRCPSHLQERPSQEERDVLSKREEGRHAP